MSNADCWGLENVVGYFDVSRNTTSEVYPSEWFFIKNCLKEGMSILDIGCAQGGFANIFAEHLSSFQYTGLDVSPNMITAAKQRNPRHNFYHIEAGDYSVLGDKQYDLVLILGSLHLHEAWRQTVVNAWKYVQGQLILDLRETSASTIEDKSLSYFSMTMGNSTQDITAKEEFLLPYNIINTTEALSFLENSCVGHSNIFRYGYFSPVSSCAVTREQQVMMNVYCVKKEATV